jgi:hypothetical protein
MPRKKKTNDEPMPSLKEQVERYIFEGISEFEQVSGLKVERVEIKHHRAIGFGAKPVMEVNIITE